MKILFISQDYYPKLSGVPVVVKYLAEGLVKKGHDVSVATRSYGNPLKKEDYNGVTIYRFDIYANILKQPVGDKKTYIDFVLNFNPDVLVLECTQCITTDILLPHISKLKCKVVFHSHGFSGLESNGPFKLCDGFLHTIGHTYNWIRSQYYFKYWLKKYASRFDATLVLAESDSGKPFLDSILGEKNHILGNAADDMFFADYDDCHNPLNELIDLKSSKYCFSCANYTVVKNQKSIIREFYKTETTDLALVCIGSTDTKYYYECLDLIKKLNQEYGYREIHLLHHVDRKDIPLIENKASLYLVSSTFEQYSISIIEAMSQGVPFISTNVGNARYLPGGITLKSPDEMHSVIDILLANEPEYKRLSDAGKRFAYNNCKINTAVDKLENIIKEL